ncbi:MAG TPA: allantoate amidohydrolase [Micromonosporaceae bacterium]|nr:allantoate amidohydrolase [Micromonosporaceae bacterium]
MSFEDLWRQLAPIGRHSDTGGYRRYAYSPAELECRAWFQETAAARDLPVETDRNGNLWAWWGAPGPGAVVTGSHLDSVPDGGAFDGPLGVISGFAAIDLLRERGFQPARPVAVVVFTEEEGGRFGIACLGSRLLTGAIAPERARELTDQDGTTLADAMSAAGLDPDEIGRDDTALARIGAYVELHIEQGRAQADLDAPIAVGTGIWPHGRWRLEFTGSADHAGTTRLVDRRDPMLTYANTVLAARKKARLAGALATVGRVLCEPNGTNAVPSRVRAWLDARAADEHILTGVITEIERASRERAGRDRTGFTMTRESYTGPVAFNPELAERIAGLLGPVPRLATGAGHDAGVLAAHVPTGMLFVRNPTGVSHSPAEHAELADCLVGVRALATVIEDLAA